MPEKSDPLGLVGRHCFPVDNGDLLPTMFQWKRWMITDTVSTETPVDTNTVSG